MKLSKKSRWDDNERESLLSDDVTIHAGSSHPRKYCCNTIPFGAFVCLLILGTVLVTVAICVAIVLPIVIVVLGGDLAQTALDSSTITFTSTTLSNPTAHTIQISNHVVIVNPGKYDATISRARVDVLDSKGRKFGQVYLPKTKIKAHVGAEFDMSETLTITNDELFRESAVQLLQGQTVHWTLNGDVDIDADFGVSVSYSPRLNKAVSIEGAPLVVVGKDVKVVKGEPDVLRITLTQEVSNPSTVSMSNLGNLTFETWVGPVMIGHLIIENFGVDAQGVTVVPNVQGELYRDNVTAHALDMFFSAWSQGKNLPLAVKGPVATSTNSAFLLNILNTNATLLGSTDRLVVNASSNSHSTVYQWASNPLDVPVSQKDLSFQIIAQDPLAISFAMPTASGGYLQVPASFQWPLLHKVNNAEASTIPAHETIRMEMNFDPATAVNFVRAVATCCFLSAQSNWTVAEPQVLTNAAGTMSLLVDQFPINFSYAQNDIPFTCISPGGTWQQFCNSGYMIHPPICISQVGTPCLNWGS